MKVKVDKSYRHGNQVMLLERRNHGMRRTETSAQENKFYYSYRWCLNPLLKFGDLLHRLFEELDRYRILKAVWQKKESKINLYLLISGIVCTIDDFLAWKPRLLRPITERFPWPRLLVVLAEFIINLPYRTKSLLSHRRLRSWRQLWNAPLERACAYLLNESIPTEDDVSVLSDMCAGLLKEIEENACAPLFRWKMKLPEGFRCQDFTHYDVLHLARRFAVTQRNPHQSVLIFGARTAGAYFSPLIKAFLMSRGWQNVVSLTVRPRWGMTRWERRQLRTHLAHCAHTLIVDDYPNTGQSIKSMVSMVTRFGMRANRITIIVPTHPRQPDWMKEIIQPGGVNLITMDHSELEKQRLLDPRVVEGVLREYLVDTSVLDVHVQENPDVDVINGRLETELSKSFQTRLKRVFDVDLLTNSGVHITKRIFAKSVGWGWLGYHAYLAGNELSGFVAPILGLRDGVLFSEWIEDVSGIATLSGISNSRRNGSVSRAVIRRFASYVAARTRKLGLEGDPGVEGPIVTWGWLELVSILRRAFGVYFGRLRDRRLLDIFGTILRFPSALIDGRMRPAEWVKSSDHWYKTDFEQHAFGAPEMDIVDPAYDLAGTVFEFNLTSKEEDELIRSYSEQSADNTIRDRFVLYKLLYANVAMRKAAEETQSSMVRQQQMEWVDRYLKAWDFLVNTMVQFCSSLLVNSKTTAWTNRLLFLDVDGVFDTEVFGFPHTTISALHALTLLRRSGYSVALNTGRSAEHVREYCKAYGLQGGVGEFGGVFIDAVHGKELTLVREQALRQLDHCRRAISLMPDVIVDPRYRYAVRAFRFDQHGRTKGLEVSQATALLRQLHCDELRAITRGSDTYFIDKNTGKANAVCAVIRYLRIDDMFTVGMGDSDEDIEMLLRTHVSYAPSNCSPRIRTLARKGNCRIVHKPHQRGFLAAVQELTGNNLTFQNDSNLEMFPKKRRVEATRSFLLKLISVAEKSRLSRLLTPL